MYMDTYTQYIYIYIMCVYIYIYTGWRYVMATLKYQLAVTSPLHTGSPLLTFSVPPWECTCLLLLSGAIWMHGEEFQKHNIGAVATLSS